LAAVSHGAERGSGTCARRKHPSVRLTSSPASRRRTSCLRLQSPRSPGVAVPWQVGYPDDDMVAADEPRVLGPHLLLSPLATGGMGSVFLAATTATDGAGPRSLCLVKTLKTGLASVSDYRPRFIDESRVAVLLRHENLCQVFGGGEAGGEFYLAMELIEGVTFKRLLSLLQHKDKQLSTTQAAALAIAMLRGLHAAHTAMAPDGRPLGVVHRDVSPHNVMVDIHGAIKVIDFGLATSVLKETFTESAVVLGKSAYMAPEQARGEDVTPAVDQYAAAVVLYELLTDDRFYGEMPSRTIWSVVGSGTHTPRAWQDVPAAFVPVLQRALSPRPAERYPSCGAFADALVAVEPDAVTADTLASIGAIVRRLKPDELDTIAAARLQLTAWDAAPKSSTPLTSTPPVSQATSGPTERQERPSTADFGQTESVSRRAALARAARSDDVDTAETSATVVTRPSALQRRTSKATLLAAALGLGTVLCLGVAVGLLVPDRATPTTTTTATTATTSTPTTRPLPPVTAVAVPAAPTPATTTPPMTPPTPAPTTTVTPPTPAGPTFDTRMGHYKSRLLKLGKTCDDPCVAVLRSSPTPTRDNIGAFEGELRRCTGFCQP